MFLSSSTDPRSYKVFKIVIVCKQPSSRLNELNISGVDDEVPSTSISSSTLDAGPSMKVSENDSSSSVQKEGAMPRLISFLKMTRLEYLFKMVLRNIASLQSLPVDFGEVGSLRHLDLSGCTNLTEMPKSFSKLLRLQYLALRGCRDLSIPSDILGGISTLEYVDFKGCAQLVALPEGIPYQRHLRYLNLLSTCLSQLPEEVEQLGNLNQLRIGSPKLTRLPRSLANLKGLTELIVLQCDRLQCEGIGAPNIKYLAVDSCPIENFSFQKDQHTMGVLRDLTLRRTSISEICMADGVYPWLQTIDLSENIQLKQVIALPSALVRVNLQDCRELETLNLSSLVNLKFLNINGCEALETLSVGGLISVEEIEAQRCWKLKTIEGMSSLERLNCLNISTDNGLFWKDVRNFLKSARRDGLSHFTLSGKMDEEMEVIQMVQTMVQLNSPDIQKVNIWSTQDYREGNSFEWYTFPSSDGAILWFITNDIGRCSFRVNFSCNRPEVSAHEFITVGPGEGGGRRLHLFLWTRYSKLFMEYSKLSIELKKLRKSVKVCGSLCCSCDASASELEKDLVEGPWSMTVTEKKEWVKDQGPWFMTVKEKRDVLEVCNKIIAPTST